MLYNVIIWPASIICGVIIWPAEQMSIWLRNNIYKMKDIFYVAFGQENINTPVIFMFILKFVSLPSADQEDTSLGDR